MASASALILFWSKKRRETAKADHYEKTNDELLEDESETYQALYRFTSAVPGDVGELENPTFYEETPDPGW
jgi:hypothetical protein